MLPDNVDVFDRDVVSGPMIRPHGLPAAKPSRVSWMTAAVAGRTAYECLCSPLGLWAGSLRRDGGRASVASNYPALPAGTRTVDVILPGVATLTDIPVVDAEDSAPTLVPRSRTPATRGSTTAATLRVAGRPRMADAAARPRTSCRTIGSSLKASRNYQAGRNAA